MWCLSPTTSSKGAPALGQKKFEPVEGHEDEKMREDEELAENAGSSGSRQFLEEGTLRARAGPPSDDSIGGA